jgi:hypothetical protein
VGAQNFAADKMSTHEGPDLALVADDSTSREDQATLAFTSYGVTVRAEVPSHDFGLDLRSYLSPQVTLLDPSPGPADVSFLRRNGDGRYILRVDGKDIGRSSDLEIGLWSTANAIHYLIAMRAPLLFVHAGVVEAGGKAIVIPGRSHSGKSSLTAALVERGCGYLSDEYAVITREGRLLPFSMPIRLRSDTGQRFLHHGNGNGHKGLPCAGVIVTRFLEGSTWSPARLSPGLTAMRLLAHAMTARVRPEPALEALRALATTAIGYEGVRGEAGPTADAILSLLESQLAGELQQGGRT